MRLYLRRGSRIINIASVAAIPPGNLAVYSSQSGSSRSIAFARRRARGSDIHVTAVCPKFMQTEFLDTGIRPPPAWWQRSGFRPRRPRGRPGPARIARRRRCTFRRSTKPTTSPRMLPYKTALAAERALGIILTPSHCAGPYRANSALQVHQPDFSIYRQKSPPCHRTKQGGLPLKQAPRSATKRSASSRRGRSQAKDGPKPCYAARPRSRTGKLIP